MKRKMIEELEKILSKDKIRSEVEDLISHSYDGYIKENLPEVVVFPETIEDVVKVVKLADKENFYITPRGSGSNLCGASVPKKGGIVLSFTKMNKIIEINKENRYAVLQPGKILDELQSELNDYGLFYPIDLGSSRIATIGGSVALNSGGMRAIKYGVTRDYILGLKVVLANGEVISTGVLAKKNVVGYDLTSLICGSEGTLGIMVEITVRLIVQPSYKKVILNHYSSINDACDTVVEILKSGVSPSALEIMDKLVLNAVEDFVKIGLQKDAGALLLIELDGHELQVEEDTKKVLKICKENKAIETKISKDMAETENLWLARKSSFGSMSRYKPICIAEDITVPVSYLKDVIAKLDELTKKYGILFGLISHAGDGNLHPHFLLDKKEEEEKVDLVMGEIMPYIVSRGGTISGEHGVGIGKKKFLNIQLKESEITIMRELKKLFDPKGIINPGSFID
ncbi:MAG: FAD-linked oxidase C-terminal domain-containing protein [Candidatus Firestonebacteria bacterium]